MADQHLTPLPTQPIPQQKQSFPVKSRWVLFITLILFLILGAVIYKNSKNRFFPLQTSQSPTISQALPTSILEQNKKKFAPGPALIVKGNSTRLINPTIDSALLKKLGQASLPLPLFEKVLPKILAQTEPTVNVYRVNAVLTDLTSATQVAEKFRFTGQPQNIDTYNRPIAFEWSRDTEKLQVFERNYIYTQSEATGSLPTLEQAVVIATEFLKTHNLYSSDIRDTVTELRTKDGGFQIDNTPTETSVIGVVFRKQVNKVPVVYGDLGADASSNLLVMVGRGNKVIKVTDSAYNYSINESQLLKMPQKELPQVIEEFKKTGGAIRWISPLPGKGWSTSGKYEIRNANIRNIYQSLYFSDGLGYSYPADQVEKNVGYLLPVWIFIGEGNIFGQGFNGETITFNSMIYGLREGQEERIFNVKDFKVNTETTPNQVLSTSFNFEYANLLNTSMDSYRPRQGLFYALEVFYPDGAYSVLSDLIRDPNYGEVVDIPTATTEGTIRVKVSLVDFPSVTAEQNVIVSLNSPSNPPQSHIVPTQIGCVKSPVYTDDLCDGYRLVSSLEVDNSCYTLNDCLPNQGEGTCIKAPVYKGDQCSGEEPGYRVMHGVGRGCYSLEECEQLK